MATAGIEDRDPRKRLEAAIAIVDGSPGSRDDAAEVLASSLAFVESISMEAMETLIRMGGEAAAPLVKMARQGTQGFSYPRMFPFDTEDGARGRSLALTALWRRTQDRGAPDPGALECFLEGLSHPYAGVRTQALHGLKELEDPNSLEALKGILNDPNTYIRDEAAALIERLETK